MLQKTKGAEKQDTSKDTIISTRKWGFVHADTAGILFSVRRICDEHNIRRVT